MPRRRKARYDFDIHVDPSCLSIPMEEETRPQSPDAQPAGDTASAHQEPLSSTPEPHTDDTVHEDDAAETSLMSDGNSVAQDRSTEAVEQENHDHEEIADTSIAASSTMSLDDECEDDNDNDNDNNDDGGDDLEAPQDTSYAEGSVIEEDESDQEGTEAQEDEGSILPSIEHDVETDAENDPQELSVLDDSIVEDDRSSHRGSSRRNSARTEALIKQAARDILAEIETQRTERQSEDHHEQADDSIISSHTDVSEDQQQHDRSEVSFVESQGEVEHEPEPEFEEQEAQHSVDEAGESSSHHGTDDDVFSDNSARNSMGSYDGGSESGKGTAVGDNITVATRTPRISDISQYDYQEEDFVPTIRGTRPPFRSPSAVRKMQMSSPPPSVFGSVVGSPRSSRRHFPTVSRLGSPAPSAQYSPKNRTPSRFKPKEAPLVLLHVTLLPLRWTWGDVINSFDASEMSEEVRNLREAWRMLQDRMGDTVFERGILLGHPQNDYEILEERLLEALDLPMRRRARILECGHYLGPANENTLGDESESEDDYDMAEPPAKKHWCNTCRNEIRYDSLGPGKIFRVKVYASNGLMKAAAWDACYKEMERVDIELEPVVPLGVNEELAQLAAAQRERETASHQQMELAADVFQQIEEHVEERMNQSYSQQSDLTHTQLEIAPAHPEPASNRSSMGEEYRHREERLAEIYGATPNPESEYKHADASAKPPHPDSYIPPPSPRSPSEEAYERREARRQSLQSASFFELLMQTARVLMQDTRNIFIVGLSFLVLLMALRSPLHAQTDSNIFEPKSVPHVQHIPVAETPVEIPETIQEQQVPVIEPSVSYSVMTQSVATQPVVVQESVAPLSVSSIQDPCSTPSVVQQVPSFGAMEQVTVRSASPEIVTQQTTVRVVETVTETETLKIETITETETMKVKATVTMTETSQTTEAMVHDLELSQKPSHWTGDEEAAALNAPVQVNGRMLLD